MNFIVNKTMNEGYLESYLTSIMAPDTGAYTGFKIYSDLTSGTTVVDGDYPFIMFAPESFLTVVATLNEKQYNGTLDLAGADFTALMNTLYSKNATERNSALDYLVTNNILVEADIAGIKSLMTDFKNFNISDLNLSYVDTTIPGNEALNDVIEYSYANPVELNTHYDSVNNTASEALYLVILPLVNKNYGLTDGTFGDYVATQSYQSGSATALQSSYMAIALGDINDATADIKYDHVDKIDYIDSFRLRFRLPKVLS